MGNSCRTQDSLDLKILEDANADDAVPMWQHDTNLLKEEAEKRKARREEEAAARKARIQAATDAAEEASKAREAANPSAGEAKKKAQAPKAEAPKVEAPKAEAPKAEAPKAESEETRKGSSVKKKAAPKASASPTTTVQAASPPKTPEQKAKEAALQKQIDEAADLTKDPDLVRYNLEIKIVSARNVVEGDANPFCICTSNGEKASKFKTKVSPQQRTPVWNQASKVHFGEGDSLLFAIMDKDDGPPLAEAELPFNQIVPSGFEGEIELKQASEEAKDGFIKVRVRVQSAFADTN
mmetsp:Transcript_95483/g.169540  ORF Transcript_95483/g.169540 Transcript_95483/m.169540 type:complete len:295 (+) Transcript_95483:52-936(+)